MLNPSAINKTWTLFLDRDGVINRRLPDDYVKHPGEFEMLPGVAQAVATLSRYFGRMVVVTNQQGIGKGLYTAHDLAAVHEKMHAAFAEAGVKIDAVYFAPQLSAENSPMRKPGIGMALKAKEDFPEIDFSRSLMVGDSASDLRYASNAGMYAIFIGDKIPEGETAIFAMPDLTGVADWVSNY
ncbi:MAG: HAD-IIIA family hydrolase [Bacteroidia bacterium]|jgi:histidinol-phosphate phosphatase family protein|nr:HAD-IIIA family hydrolase [Bacteroidia bacterium]